MRMVSSLIIVILLYIPNHNSMAEYGDVIINNYSTKAGINPVVFPHWFHRIRYTCKVCHHDLGIHFKAGDNKIKMLDLMNGQYCGTCHNGEIAWGIDRCDLCHSGGKKIKTNGTRSMQDKLKSMKDSQKQIKNKK